MAHRRDYLLVLFSLCIIASPSVLVSVYGYSSSPGLTREAITGIWRLSSKRSFLPRLEVLCTEEQNVQKEDKELLLNLNEDGSFVQYNSIDEENAMTTKIKGKWDYRGTKLILAIDRPPHSKILQVNDTIIVGKVSTQVKKSLVDNPVVPLMEENETKPQGLMKRETDVYLSIPNGKVSVGKFTYPRNHPSFFDNPMFQPTNKGTVQLHQVLGILNTQQQSGSYAKDDSIERFKTADFHGKKFIFTSIPVQPKRKTPEPKWDRKLGKYISDKRDTLQQPIDIRIMPMEFFANNTFCATGSSKILRGRFGITGEQKDQLWFQVSLFGSGRTAPGSVYSEGDGLTHEDRRSYLGDISYRNEEGSESEKTLLVEGAALVGSDFGSDARTEPVAHFTMRQVKSLSLDDDESDENIDHESSESVFE